jgi:hypothetical protein
LESVWTRRSCYCSQAKANITRSRTGKSPREKLHWVASTNHCFVQTLIPSQPLLAHWFKRRLSLAQVSTLAYRTDLTKAYCLHPGDCQRRIWFGRADLRKHDSHPHREVVGQVLFDHQRGHLRRRCSTLHTIDEAST